MSEKLVTTLPEEWKPMLETTQLIISELHECIHAGGDWTNVQMAMMGFALEIKDQTIREMQHHKTKTTPEVEAAERRGYAAFINGKGLKDCPIDNEDEKAAWVRGFNRSAATPYGGLL